jgi:hypothetical protein
MIDYMPRKDVTLPPRAPEAAEIAALRARLEAVEKDQLELVKRYDEMTRRVEQTEVRAERAEAALATARRDALEEAAKRLDRDVSWSDAADAIRALANEAKP